MPDLFLRCGRIAQVSEDDADWAREFPWRSWNNGKVVYVRRDFKRKGKVTRLWLQREIAVRMEPELRGQYFMVRFKDEDTLNVRRENLQILYGKSR